MPSAALASGICFYRPAAGWLVAPAMIVVLALLVLPLAWLILLSMADADGAFTIANYAKLATSGYVRVFLVTFEVAIFTTLACAILAYPVAYLLARLRPVAFSACMTLVLLPFWTSALVRTYAWLVILQRNGPVNKALTFLGISSEPLALVNNLTGTVIGMIHILLPFMILPLYSTLKAIDDALIRAATSCGATPFRTFRDVILPLSMPGLLAGSVLVFILSLGFYLTPALLGGGKVPMIAMQIEASVARSGDWGPASALGAVLLGITFAVLAVLSRIFRIDRLYGDK